jgi:hypothetical protein
MNRIGIPPSASYEEFVCRVSGLLIWPVAAKKKLRKAADRMHSYLRSLTTGQVRLEPVSPA